jgi:hypothetical protein
MAPHYRVQVHIVVFTMLRREQGTLRGTARIWWDQYYTMQLAGHVVTWDEFRTAFRAHHIPEGLVERKLNEFLTLTQGTRTVMQYA